ncbi:MAG: hypothetical protein WCW35_07605 [Bacteroidota bacterium]|jgi:hypothetical protein
MVSTIDRIFVLLTLSAFLGFFGCSSVKSHSEHPCTRYVFSYTMVQPENNDQLHFHDSNIDVQFSIDNGAIIFQLKNNTDQHLSIAWDRAGIAVNKQSFSVRNIHTFYSAGNATPLPVIVKPEGFLKDIVIPWEHVYVDRGRWIEKELFPTCDSGSLQTKATIEKTTGSEVLLTLPVKIGKIVMDYSFTFKVTGITALPTTAFPPAQERPPKPDIPQNEAPSFMQGYLPIFISAGILVVAIYLFSQKKSAAVEF